MKNKWGELGEAQKKDELSHLKNAKLEIFLSRVEMLPEKVVSLREEGPSCENGNTAEIVDTGFEI